MNRKHLAELKDELTFVNKQITEIAIQDAIERAQRTKLVETEDDRLSQAMYKLEEACFWLQKVIDD